MYSVNEVPGCKHSFAFDPNASLPARMSLL